MTRLFFLLFLLGCCHPLVAQETPYSFQITLVDHSAETPNYRKELPDSLSVWGEIQTVLETLQSGAYLAASVDSVAIAGKEARAWFFVGPKFSVLQVKNGNIPEPLLRQAGFREQAFRRKPFSWDATQGALTAILEEAENSGYPLARIWLDSVRLVQGQVAASLFWTSGPLMTLEQLSIEGDARIAPAYLQRYLGLGPGQPFSRKKILQIPNRIRELPFLAESKASSVAFQGNAATITLFLKRQKASRFDFLLGILPTRNEGPNQRLLLTGTLEAELLNQFGLGEQIRASFEQLRPGTQDLELAFSYPYVLQIPFGVDLAFNQYKRDSTYSDVIFDFGLRYQLEGGNYIKAFWNVAQSNLIQVNEQQVINTRRLPATLDVSNRSFGLEYLWQQLDYRRNPREGWSLFARAGAGFKNIRPNTILTSLVDPSDPSFDFNRLYDTLQLRTFQFRLQGKVERFFPVFGGSALMLRGQGGYIYAPVPIYQNEQFRIGGNRLLRGFDEESLFVTLYGVATLEYRLLIDRNSYFFIFGDYGYLEDVTSVVRRADRPFGLGAGLSFSTRAGQFGLSLAVGSQQGEPIDWQNPKVHLGYLSFF